MLRLSLLVAIAAASLLAQGKNVLIYGNSLSLFNGGVEPILTALAVEAGQPQPFVLDMSVTGQALNFHATDPTQVAAITTGLPAGQHWDIVVLQGISHETTTTLGNPAQFVADAATILTNVRAHSPNAEGILFQTYARAHGHSWYPSTFADPMEMHNQVRTTCRNAAQTLSAMFGAGTVRNSAIGDGAALLEFDPQYYFVDLQHPAPSLTFVSAMCLFTSIYGLRACDVTPDLSTPSALGARLINFGFGLADWRRLAGIADRCAEPGARRYPGSGDHLLLETGVTAGSFDPCPLESLVAGATVELRLSSRNGVFDAVSGALLAHLFVTGQPPVANPVFPELALADPIAILLTGNDLTAPLTLSVPLPFTITGASVLVQGVAFGPSAETGNLLFATTDAHELVFQ
ncbi:MAG TPA: hypothetical protein ENI87_12175 [bacterium]|nr:hypothetical protein [bacterium]